MTSPAPNSPAPLPLLWCADHLSRLAFISYLEAHTEHGEVLRRRSLPLEQRLALPRGYTRLLRLESVKDSVTYSKEGKAKTSPWNKTLEFTMLSEQPDRLDSVIDGMSWLLCPNNDAGMFDVMTFNDLAEIKPSRVDGYEGELPPPVRLHKLLNGYQVKNEDKCWYWPNNPFTKNHKPKCVMASIHGPSGPNKLSLEVHVNGSSGIFTLTRGKFMASRIRLEPGTEFILQPRFIDLTTSKLTSCLAEEARFDLTHQQQALGGTLSTPLMRQILCNTISFGEREPPTLGEPVAAVDSAAIDSLFPMTNSQHSVYEHLSKRALTLVWGPPGSGKTYFLTMAICRLLRTAYLQGQPMRILVSAFTHEAMDLVLMSVAKSLDRLWPEDDPPEVIKLSSRPEKIEKGAIVKDKPAIAGAYYRVLEMKPDGDVVVEGVEWVTGRQWVTTAPLLNGSICKDPAKLAREYKPIVLNTKSRAKLGKERYVIGMTAFYAKTLQALLCEKELLTPGDKGYYDVLVLDEASQFPIRQLPPLAHLLLRMPPQEDQPEERTGRLVVVGDPRQMGLILQNEYPLEAMLTEGSPPPHWSLLSWLRAAVTQSEALRVDLSRMLRDNHRMNDSLARFTRTVLEYEGYNACHDNDCPCHRDGIGPGKNGVPLLKMSYMPPRALVADEPSGLLYKALLPEHTFVVIEMLCDGDNAAVAYLDPKLALVREAWLVVELILAYLRWRDNGHDDSSVFVVAPHHVQRIEIQRQLDIRRGDVCMATIKLPMPSRFSLAAQHVPFLVS